ncbi:hypothetical protein ACFQX6_34695 [Streptosporangium lutulentum]
MRTSPTRSRAKREKSHNGERRERASSSRSRDEESQDDDEDFSDEEPLAKREGPQRCAAREGVLVRIRSAGSPGTEVSPMTEKLTEKLEGGPLKGAVDGIVKELPLNQLTDGLQDLGAALAERALASVTDKVEGLTG